ncbi:chromo domain-like protein, partial [Martensiomyces pterosporus]
MTRPAQESTDEVVEDIAVSSQEEEEEEADNEEVYVVEKIIKHRGKKAGEREYLLKWEGYPDSENTWEREENIFDKDMLQRYWDAIDDAKAASATKANGRRPPRHSNGSATPVSPATAARQNKRRRTSDIDSDGDGDGESDESGAEPAPSSFGADDWEPHIREIETIDRVEGIGLVVYISWKNGNRTKHPVEDAYQKCPQLMLRFYEGRLRFRSK